MRAREDRLRENFKTNSAEWRVLLSLYAHTAPQEKQSPSTGQQCGSEERPPLRQAGSRQGRPGHCPLYSRGQIAFTPGPQFPVGKMTSNSKSRDSKHSPVSKKQSLLGMTV